MPKINVYLPEGLAAAVRDAQVPVSAVCQSALERAVREVSAMRGHEEAGAAKAAPQGEHASFTPRAVKVKGMAEALARAHGHKRVESEHLLLGLLDEGQNLAVRVLHALEVDPQDVRSELVASMPPDGKKAPKDLPLGPSVAAALELSLREALTLGHNYIGCEHFLLGLVAEEAGLAGKVLRRMGLELRTTRRAVGASVTGVAHAKAEAAPAARTTQATLEAILRRLEAIEDRLAG